MEVLAIIPARGGSVSILRKNLMPHKGIPLVAHSILYAKNDPYVNRVVVSTDDEEIATISRKYGAEIPFIRPRELAEDKVPTFPVVKHATDALNKNGYTSDVTIVLEPTIPDRPKNLVRGCLDIFSNNRDCDAVVPVYMSPIPIQKIFVQKGKYIQNALGVDQVRQEFSINTYCFSQHIKAYRTICILNNQIQHGFGNSIMPLIIDQEVPSMDIDTTNDLKAFMANPNKKWWQ